MSESTPSLSYGPQLSGTDIFSPPSVRRDLPTKASGRAPVAGEKAWFKAICLTRWDPVFGPRTDRIWLTRSEDTGVSCGSGVGEGVDEESAAAAAREEKKSRSLLSQTYSELAEKLLTNLELGDPSVNAEERGGGGGGGRKAVETRFFLLNQWNPPLAAFGAFFEASYVSGHASLRTDPDMGSQTAPARDGTLRAMRKAVIMRMSPSKKGGSLQQSRSVVFDNQLSSNSRFGLQVLFSAEFMGEYLHLHPVLEDRLTRVALRLRALLNATRGMHPQVTLKQFSTSQLYPFTTGLSSLYSATNSLDKCAISNQVLLLHPVFTKQLPLEFLGRAVTSHLMTHRCTVVVGRNLDLVNQVISILGSFLKPKERARARFLLDRRTRYTPDLFLQGVVDEPSERKLIQSMLPSSIVNVDQQSVQQTLLMYHYQRFRSKWMEKELCAFLANPGSKNPSDNLASSEKKTRTLLESAPSIIVLLQNLTLLPPHLHQGYIREWCRITTIKAFTLIRYVDECISRPLLQPSPALSSDPSSASSASSASASSFVSAPSPSPPSRRSQSLHHSQSQLEGSGTLPAPEDSGPASNHHDQNAAAPSDTVLDIESILRIRAHLCLETHTDFAILLAEAESYCPSISQHLSQWDLEQKLFSLIDDLLG
ncbi:MAG: hypothetical protein Q8P67_08250 [archaeon]|nr:hypothetical protein [archaeon]